MSTREKNRLRLTPEFQATFRGLIEAVRAETEAMGKEFGDLTPDEWHALKENAHRGQKLRRTNKASDETLELLSSRVRRDFPGLKAREYDRRVGKEVGLCASRVQYHRLRIERAKKK